MPVTEEYKQEFAAVNQSTNEVELSYQTESMDSFTALEAESVAADSVEVAAVVDQDMSPEEEILNQPADYYTVQLMASLDVERVYKFAEQNQISIRYIVPTVRDGVIWHVLLLDVYPDHTSATAGLSEIIDNLNTRPWIRSLGAIQKLMQ